jgi:hypothetical protein
MRFDHLENEAGFHRESPMLESERLGSNVPIRLLAHPYGA